MGDAASNQPERRQRMDKPREQFVEPEIIKHEEKMADVTTSPVGYTDDATIDGAV
jgi:hypothetical protein